MKKLREKVFLISLVFILTIGVSNQTSGLNSLDPKSYDEKNIAYENFFENNDIRNYENYQSIEKSPKLIADSSNKFYQNLDFKNHEGYQIHSWDLHSKNFPKLDHPDDVQIAVTNDEKVRTMIKLEDDAAISQILQELEADFVDYLPSSNILIANVKETKGHLIADPFDNQQLSIPSGIKSIEPDYVIQTNFIPNDPKWSQQWGPQKIGLITGWDTQLGNQSVLVAVMDTGVDYNHIDLVDNYDTTFGYDYVNADAFPMDDNGHGTHVAGTIAASINNNEGIAGVANVSIFAQKILDAQGSGFYSWAIDAIYNATDEGADILSNSWGGSAYSSNLEDAVNYAVDNGALFIAAAGNDASIAPHYPAGFERAISVSATNSTDGLASFSNFGPTVDISAPGVDIISTIPNDNYDTLSGTSMATPHVSGLAALYWSQFRSYSASQIENLIYSSAIDLGDPGYDTKYGWGRINVSDAMNGLDNYDVSVKVRQTEHRTFDDTLIYNVTVENTGLLSVSSFDLLVYVDGALNNQQPIGTLQSGEEIHYSFGVSNQFEKINITAYIMPLSGENFVLNNKDTIFLKSFKIANLVDNQEVAGGLIYMDPVLLDPVELATFNFYISGNWIAEAPGKGVSDEKLFFPVFDNGTNSLTLQAKWIDGTFYNFDITIFSFDVVPLLNIEIGDQIVWTWDNLDGSYQDQVYTFDEWISPFEVNVSLYAKDYDSFGILWEDTFWAIINVVNGYYVSTDFGWDYNRFSFITGANSIFSEVSNSSVFPGFFSWNSVHTYVDRISTSNDYDIIVGDVNGVATEINKATGLLNSYGTGFLNSTTFLPQIRDIAVEITVQNDEIIPNQELIVVGDVRNVGDFVGRNVEIFAYIDGTLEVQRSIDILFTDTSEIVELPITLTPEMLGGEINVTVSTSILDDNNSNNKQNYFVDLTDTTAPVLIESSGDISYTLGETGNEIVWKFEDKFPANFSILINGEEEKRGSWLSNQLISINVDGLEVGEHEVMITVNDWLLQTTTDTVIVSVLTQTSSIGTSTDTTASNSQTSDTSENGDPLLDLPGFGLYIGLIPLVSIPFLRKLRSKIHYVNSH